MVYSMEKGCLVLDFALSGNKQFIIDYAKFSQYNTGNIISNLRIVKRAKNLYWVTETEVIKLV